MTDLSELTTKHDGEDVKVVDTYAYKCILENIFTGNRDEFTGKFILIADVSDGEDEGTLFVGNATPHYLVRALGSIRNAINETLKTLHPLEKAQLMGALIHELAGESPEQFDAANF